MLLLGLLAAGALGTSVGCSATPRGATSAQASEPSFSGPYAAEYARNYREAPNDEVRQILFDEHVSEAEAQQIIEEYRDCLESRGITLVKYDDTGSQLEGDPARMEPGDMEDLIEGCSESSGERHVLSLFQITRSVPGNDFSPALLVSCLIRAGIVPEDFTAQDYEEGLLDSIHPPAELYEPAGQETREKIEACSASPDTLFR